MRPALTAAKRVLLRVEDPRRAAVVHAASPASLTTQPSGARLPRRIASPPRALIGVSIGTTTSWPSVSTTAAAISPSVRPSTLSVLVSTQPAFASSRATSATPPAGMDVGGDEAAERLQVGDDRRPRRDRVEVVDREVDRELLRDRDEMEDAVRRPAGRGDGRAAFSIAAFVMICDGRTSSRTRSTVRRPASAAASSFDVSSAGMSLRPAGADAEELERGRHRVRGELPAAGASPGQATDSSSCRSAAVIFPAAYAPICS